MGYTHINDCWNALRECKTYDEACNLVLTFPRWSGDWTIEVVDNNVRATNTWWDRETESEDTDVEDLDITVVRKYYAEECTPEHYDYTMYYDEDQAKSDGIWFGGNRYFCNMNDELISSADTALRDSYNLIDDGEDATLVIKQNFKKKDTTELTEEEINSIKKYIDDFAQAGTQSNEYDIIADVLTILEGQEYIVSSISGCSQGDWMDVICPKTLKESLSWISAVLFATGTEYRVSEDKLAGKNDFDRASTYCMYTNKWSDEDILQTIAEECGCKVEEVEIIK